MVTAILESVSANLMPDVCGAVEEGSAVQVTSSEFDRRTEAWAKAVFQAHPHLRRQAKLIQCGCRNKCLQLSGMLPSYYLKQLAQEALRSSCRDLRIENRIVVVNPKTNSSL